MKALILAVAISGIGLNLLAAEAEGDYYKWEAHSFTGRKVDDTLREDIRAFLVKQKEDGYCLRIMEGSKWLFQKCDAPVEVEWLKGGRPRASGRIEWPRDVEIGLAGDGRVLWRRKDNGE